MRSPRTAMKSSPCLPQLEKACAQQRRPNAAKKKKGSEFSDKGKNQCLMQKNENPSAVLDAGRQDSKVFQLLQENYFQSDSVLSQKLHATVAYRYFQTRLYIDIQIIYRSIYRYIQINTYIYINIDIFRQVSLCASFSERYCELCCCKMRTWTRKKTQNKETGASTHGRLRGES